MSSTGFFVTFPLSQTFTVSSLTTVIPYDTVPALLGYNSGMYDSTTHKAYVTVGGVYSVSASVNFEWNLNNRIPIVGLSLYVNGNKTILGNANPILTNDPEVISFSGDVYLQQNSEVYVVLTVPTIAGQTVRGANFNTYFSMNLCQ